MRYIYPYILKDLKKKMVFVDGPRQVGKTTLAKAVQIVATAKRPYDRNRLRVTGPLDYFQPPW